MKDGEMRVARIAVREMSAGIWCGSLKGNKSLRRPRHGWENNIKWDFREWTGLIWLRIVTNGGAVVNTVMSLRVP
jgi:hypothetical protein